ncbi:fumarylacetoacetate hydrolase family protein [Lichenicola cladoniae]|uniref:Fumarylacetoacetate hydrolase family protein n=1 Tax=Lichenicola cladoniae TaxID=1484109 RepID=A0A6M8HU21_9PROT|nr:fumarylacetoacetate hydrolase family protein [Lichenicola cladoniae]NPD67590.1 fumarylacetoacetate hydrolase family protein [Acetobacteraceae bacterium]QKE91766.1 fumarylacetoacetate hydrolase family protein [Lichenicola cladoniae]
MHAITVLVPTIPVQGSASPFPVRRIWCVGQNYADHAREMGGDPDRAPPFFFAKPGDAVVPGGGTLVFPPETASLHHEVELVVAIGIGGRSIDPVQALDHVYGYAVGLDMTRRDLQAEAKKLGRPWALAKGFDQSCPIGGIVPAVAGFDPSHGAITLTVNGVLRQSGDLSQMIWTVAEAIAFLSRFVALAPGDLIMTGTPAGVGPVLPGDLVTGTCEGLGDITVRYVAGDAP